MKMSHHFWGRENQLFRPEIRRADFLGASYLAKMVILSGTEEGAPGSGSWPIMEVKYGNFGIRLTGRYYNSNLRFLFADGMEVHGANGKMLQQHKRRVNSPPLIVIA